MLKHFEALPFNEISPAATFGWLCVETFDLSNSNVTFLQPPSGGCVLKHQNAKRFGQQSHAATFGWLCVETKCDGAKCA